jgi:hypothetical protein
VSVNTQAPLFVPSVRSVSPFEFPATPTVMFTFEGEFFYPCGLQVNIYRTNATNLVQVCVCVGVCIFGGRRGGGNFFIYV